MLFSSGPSPRNARKFPSARRNQLGEKVRQILPIPVFHGLGHTFRPGPRDPKRMTTAKYRGIGKKQIFIHHLLKDRQRNIYLLRQSNI